MYEYIPWFFTGLSLFGAFIIIILAVGQTVAAFGGTVRPSKVSALEGKSRRRMNQPKRVSV